MMMYPLEVEDVVVADDVLVGNEDPIETTGGPVVVEDGEYNP
jgi:hypothetical protein